MKTQKFLEQNSVDILADEMKYMPLADQKVASKQPLDFKVLDDEVLDDEVLDDEVLDDEVLDVSSSKKNTSAKSLHKSLDAKNESQIKLEKIQKLIEQSQNLYKKFANDN